jgi:hypothetical protein
VNFLQTVLLALLANPLVFQQAITPSITDLFAGRSAPAHGRASAARSRRGLTAMLGSRRKRRLSPARFQQIGQIFQLRPCGDFFLRNVAGLCSRLERGKEGLYHRGKAGAITTSKQSSCPLINTPKRRSATESSS